LGPVYVPDRGRRECGVPRRDNCSSQQEQWPPHPTLLGTKADQPPSRRRARASHSRVRPTSESHCSTPQAPAADQHDSGVKPSRCSSQTRSLKFPRDPLGTKGASRRVVNDERRKQDRIGGLADSSAAQSQSTDLWPAPLRDRHSTCDNFACDWDLLGRSHSCYLSFCFPLSSALRLHPVAPKSSHP
jgi:hypothetical protein